jgi:hypothetical protein
MTALHTLGILSNSFTQNAFPTVLKEFPHMLSTCWLAFSSLFGPIHPKPFWRPGHLMQHSITLLFNQTALAHPGGVLGHCPVEKQMIVPLSANNTGMHISEECCGSHAG